MMVIALLENLQRENLNAMEEATAYRKLLQELNITQDELASRIGKSRSHITNMLGLLTLPEEVKNMLLEDKISMSHARVLSKIEDSNKVISLANRVYNEGLNVRILEDLASSNDLKKKNKIVRHHVHENEYHYLEEQLTEKLGTKVKIKNNHMMISFANTNDLNRILEIMGMTYDE